MAGRPKRVFTGVEIAKIRRYARNNSKSETIASALDIPVNSLKRHFGRKMTIWRAEGKVKLKQTQQRMAIKSPQMAIWLGKQDLGQVDKQEIRTEAVDTKSRTEQQLEADKAAARAYNESMSKTEPNPQIVKFKG